MNCNGNVSIRLTICVFIVYGGLCVCVCVFVCLRCRKLASHGQFHWNLPHRILEIRPQNRLKDIFTFPVDKSMPYLIIPINSFTTTQNTHSSINLHSILRDSIRLPSRLPVHGIGNVGPSHW